MSDIQDLIHTQTVKAYESGVRHEQERIIKLLEDNFASYHVKDDNMAWIKTGLLMSIIQIKEENNG
jgi:hypothetical protein